MQLFLVTAVIFALAMLGIAFGMMASGGQHECGCKKAARIMKQKEDAACAGCSENGEQPLVDIDLGGDE